jgi:hypothetical protein
VRLNSKSEVASIDGEHRKMSADGIDYKAVIADLKARRAALDAVIVGLEQWQGLGGSEDSPLLNRESTDQRSEPTEIKSDTFFGLSIPDAIRKCFRISKRPLSLSELTNSLKSGGLLTSATDLMATVSGTLQRVKRQSGEVVSLGNGQWGLAEWYPGLRKEKIEAVAKPRGKRRRAKKVARKATGDSKPQATTEQVETIKTLNAAGKKLGEIAREVGLHHFVVMRILKAGQAATG